MNTVTFDTLKHTKNLENAGFSRKQAEAWIATEQEILTEVFASNKDNYASKEEVSVFKSEFKGDFRALDSSVDAKIANAKLEIINRIRLSNNSAIVNNSNVIEQKINDRYPMLEFIDFYNIEESDKAEKILNYIEQIDDLIESAIESTDLEIKQNSITKEEISV